MGKVKICPSPSLTLSLFDQAPAHHNTGNLSGDQLTKATDKAEKQDAVILSFFERNPGQIYTPYDVLGFAYPLDPKPPIGSIRRSITGLTKRKLLVKTEHRREGGAGAYNFCWKLNAK